MDVKHYICEWDHPGNAEVEVEVAFKTLEEWLTEELTLAEN